MSTCWPARIWPVAASARRGWNALPTTSRPNSGRPACSRARPDGKWSQKFRVDEGEDGKPHEVRNIIGVLPGSNPDMAGEAVIVAAHYDHLGRGWPDSRAAAGDGVYFGADDNASGVAVLLELAATLAGEAAPERSIVFIAFTGEEAGKLGSKYFVANPAPYALEGIIGVVNMDTVGRLEGKDLSVFGAGSASEWQHVFRGIGFTTGIQSTMITTELDSSDQQSFIDVGIPGVQISSGATYDYHRPTDTADKIDGDGLVKVAVVAKEAVTYLASRPEKLTVTIAAAADVDAPAKPSQPGSRRASVGTVPDFAYSGNGVRVGSVVPGSPAAAAGIREGDILVRLADKPVSNLQEYSDVLKTLEPGQVVGLTIQRDGTEQDMSVTLTDR